MSRVEKTNDEVRIDREKLNEIKAEIYYRHNLGHQISVMKA